MLDLLIEIEMTVKNNAKDFKMVSDWNDRTTLTSDTGKGEVLAS